MKIAVINTPFATHIGRTQFVLKTLSARGHQVELWGSGETGAIASSNGFGFREVPLVTDFSEVMQRRLKPQEIFTEMFFRLALEQLDTVLRYCEQHKPDVLEANARVFSASVASMITGIPLVTHCCSGNSFSQAPEDLYGFCVKGTESPRQLKMMRRFSDAFFAETDDWFNRHIGARYGLPRVENAIGLCSREFATAQTIRELSNPRIASLPNVKLTGPIVRESTGSNYSAPDGPYCYISLGTSPWNEQEILGRYRMLAEHVPAKFRVVIGLGGLYRPEELGIEDPRVTVLARAPQIAAIKGADFVICHGGCQTVHEALYFGKPIIGIPHQAEISEMVNSVERVGAGVGIPPENLVPAKIASAVEMVTSPETISAAQVLSRLLQQADGHANSLAVFDALAQRRRDAV